MRNNIINLTGIKFGYLTVISIADKPNGLKSRGSYWNCICKCGNHKIVKGYSLTSGHTKSCGCYKEGRYAHGMSDTKLYGVWCAMKHRCANAKDRSYYLYGGKGVKVCDNWINNFKNFFTWSIKNGYCEGLTVERLNSNGNYVPENCKWADRTEQNNNTNRNVFVDGKTIGQHATEQNRPYYKVYYELKDVATKL